MDPARKRTVRLVVALELRGRRTRAAGFSGAGKVIGWPFFAKTGEAPHSATAQFFINVKDNDFLNFRGETAQGWGYTVFGRVVSGMGSGRRGGAGAVSLISCSHNTQ